MSAALAERQSLEAVSVNGVLFDSVQTAVRNAMDMCGVKIRCTGVSSVPTAQTGIVTGMIGVHGKVTGFATVNLAEQFAVRAVEGLLADKFDKLTSQVVDGAGEITNIIVGGIKSGLAKTEWGFSHITIPSVLVGNNLTIAYARGLDFLTVSFEHDDPEAVRLEDRMMHVSLSLLTL
ncbi:MAG: chemotaxis protein CheX [Pirellulales bacterium]|nr:chemotaxis protein CheX [Pirellulales bacterium]MBX3434073.1 chemotaxis protein CheX [Pirellulales bacterium]